MFINDMVDLASGVYEECSWMFQVWASGIEQESTCKLACNRKQQKNVRFEHVE